MTLATQCPYCQTTFRVAKDQLALREGLVRCGVCTRVFNGNELLQSNPPATAPESESDDTALSVEEHSNTDDAVLSSPSIEDQWFEEATASYEPPLYSASPEGFSAPTEHEEPADQEWITTDDETAPEIDLASLVTPDSHAGPHTEPTFIRKARRKARFGLLTRIFLSIASVLLVIALLGQGMYYWRHQLSVWLPPIKPLLVAACAQLKCTVGLSTNIEEFSLESNELEALPGAADNYLLSLLMRNNGDLPQAWPYIELTLNDEQQKPVIKRVFRPQDYLSPGHPTEEGFTRHSEQSVIIQFHVAEAISGYRVYLFYP